MHKARMANKEITKGKKFFAYLFVFLLARRVIWYTYRPVGRMTSMKPTHVLLTIATRSPLKPDRPPFCLFNRMFLWEPIRSKLATRM